VKKIFFMALLSLTTGLYATTLSSQSEYMPEETITIQVNNLEVHDKNWLGIYALNDTNDWNNVLRWIWTGETTTGSFSLKGLPQGEYEARVFYNNSFQTEAKTAFLVKDQFNPAVDIETRKDTYEEHEFIEVKVENMSGHAQDWVAIYPKGSSNEWENVIAWRYTNGLVGTIIGFEGLNAGEYEVRAFFKNSYQLEASHSFSVVNHQSSLSPSQTVYDISENIQINISGFKNNQKDWIGIYPKGSSNAWENVVAWKWADDANNNTLNFPSLAVGEYEVRGFFKNSYTTEISSQFVVKTTDSPVIEVLNKAKKHCLESNLNNQHVLCSNTSNIAYVVTGDALLFYIYEVNIQENTTKLFTEIQRAGGNSGELLFQKLNNTDLIAMYHIYDIADPTLEVLVYDQNGKRQIYREFTDDTRILSSTTILDNGQKLQLIYKSFQADAAIGWIRMEEVFDISNITNIKSISTKELCVEKDESNRQQMNFCTDTIAYLSKLYLLDNGIIK